MIKKITAALLGLSILIALSACAVKGEDNTDNEKVHVSVTFNVLKEFVQAVGGDKTEVSVIIPDGTEPHDFEPKAQDLSELSKAQILVMNGLGMETWISDAVKASGNSNIIIVDASNGVNPIPLSSEGMYDPHIWLGLKCAETEAKNICDALTQADPDNSAYYEDNCNTFISQLEALYNEYSAKFAVLENKSFVTGHAAFGYLCRDFGLIQNSVEDVFAEGEPSAQQLAALIDYCRENNVTTIFSEALMSADIAETLARETGAQVKAIYTLESAENGKSYLERMEENLSVIYESLK